MKQLQQRILDLSYKHRLSHLGSCFSTLPILYEIYTWHKDDIIILSNGHSGLAQYCCLEHFYGHNAEELLVKHGIHPAFDPDHHIYCSTGSLGMGICVAAGYALAGNSTHVVISDGECSEGSVWEALTFIKENNLPINVHCNINGLSAYKRIDKVHLARKLSVFYPPVYCHYTTNYPLPDQLESHYHVLTKEEYEAISSQLITY